MGLVEKEHSINEEETLPFSKPKQEALLGFLLTDERFFAQARHRIKPEWFADPRHNQVWGIALRFAQKYNRAAKATEVSDCPELNALDNKDVIKLQSVIQMCLTRRMDYGMDALTSELTDWLKARIFLSNMKKSEALFNAGSKVKDSKKLEEAYAVMRSMTRELDDTTFDQGHVEDMSDPVGDFERQIADAKCAISFGLPALDRLLLPEGAGNGSLLKEDMTVLLAPTNIGKTTTMVTTAAHNIWAEKDVLIITHEGRTNDIKLKIWQSMMGMTRQQVLGNLGNPEFRAALETVKALVNKHLEFLPLAKPGLTVEEVEVIIARRQERWQANHNGKGFDLLIDDYAAKLTTAQAKGGQFALRQIHEVVYNYFTQIAIAHKFHVITAIQTNREGSKANSKHKSKKDVESRLLTMEDVMESWGPMTTATNVISINRDPLMQAKNLVTFLICKSRSSEVNWAVVCKSNYAAAQSHAPDAPCTWYRGTSPMSERIDSMLAGYGGKEIPWEEVLKYENEGV